MTNEIDWTTWLHGGSLNGRNLCGLPDHLREELSRAADLQGMPDRQFVRNALVSALVKHAQRLDTRSDVFERGLPLPMYDG